MRPNAPTELEDPELESTIQAGLESGPERVVDESFWEDLRRDALEGTDRTNGG